MWKYGDEKMKRCGNTEMRNGGYAERIRCGDEMIRCGDEMIR